MKIIDNTFADYETALPPVMHNGQQMIDARSLHGWLEHKWAFSRWITHRISEYGFEAGTDFLPLKVKTPGRPKTDYLLTLDMAKELAMVERTDKGRETRRYFIQMEKAGNPSIPAGLRKRAN